LIVRKNKDERKKEKSRKKLKQKLVTPKIPFDVVHEQIGKSFKK